MFEEFPYILGFLLFSIVISYLLLEYIPEPFKKIIVGVMIIGIVIHELFHVLMCLITNTPINSVKFLEKIKKEEGPGYIKYEFNGNVSIKGEKEMSFLQAVLVGFAPLLFSFWIFFLLLDQVIHPTNEIIFFICLFTILSILFSAAPSSADLKCIPIAFGENIEHSIFQIFLLLLSIFTTWSLSVQYNLIFSHELIYYLLIAFFYYGFKYGFKGIHLIYNSYSNLHYKQSIGKSIKNNNENIKKYKKR